MPFYAALEVSQETTAICVVDDAGRVRAEKKVATFPRSDRRIFESESARPHPGRLETGPLAVCLWKEFAARRLPILCIDARHANAALKMRPVKTDLNNAAGLAQIMRAGWSKQVRIKSRDSYQVRSLLVAREMLVQIRGKIENEIRGLLRIFGVLFGKRAGGFTGRADEVAAGELDASPEIRLIVETLMKARSSILDQIKILDCRPMAFARASPTAYSAPADER